MSRAEQEYRAFLHDEGKMEHTGNRKRIWDGAQRALLEWARSKTFVMIEEYADGDKEADHVSISDLESYFEEKVK